MTSRDVLDEYRKQHNTFLGTTEYFTISQFGNLYFDQILLFQSLTNANTKYVTLLFSLIFQKPHTMPKKLYVCQILLWMLLVSQCWIVLASVCGSRHQNTDSLFNISFNQKRRIWLEWASSSTMPLLWLSWKLLCKCYITTTHKSCDRCPLCCHGLECCFVPKMQAMLHIKDNCCSKQSSVCS
jgi:hypothetical protein